MVDVGNDSSCVYQSVSEVPHPFHAVEGGEKLCGQHSSFRSVTLSHHQPSQHLILSVLSNRAETVRHSDRMMELDI
jgi:hypothetical protein